jgi:hypothetical protein
MTPEELRRTIEFIVESQARLAAAQEQDREDRIEFQKSAIEFQKSTLEFQKWARDMNLRIMGMIQMQTQTLEIQSRRLDQYEAQDRANEENQRGYYRASEQAAQRRHEELLVRLDRVLDMLTGRLN